MTVYAGQGDARRTMAVLWGTETPKETRPGPKPGLSVEVIVAAGIEVADAEGMAALSMRAVGERLGRTAMALYTYVPGKTELLDLMVDRVMAEVPATYPRTDGWRAAVTAWAHDLRAFYLRHPWVLQVSQARPVLGPNEFAVVETLTALLRETGLPAARLRGVVAALMDVVRGAARTVAESRRAPAETGVTDQEWWAARSALMREIAPDFAGRFPAVTWLERGDAVPDDGSGTPYLEQVAQRAFAEGLGTLLDGITAR
ncbi:TetR/AcrR family transcriptional regulator [Nonomuraea typhae]|uniref:TetR/AcrR family transcriptional regulator n=1 Tax=Nonomuraea typhae TaxID=2603600 RepID=UPI0012FB433A|nr:TetR/AcrR family transcriptional regulator [Nonomuraea typhae]